MAVIMASLLRQGARGALALTPRAYASVGIAVRAKRRVRWSWSNRARAGWLQDRKSTRLNSSHVAISYAVFCLKKKTPDHSASVDARNTVTATQSRHRATTCLS